MRKRFLLVGNARAGRGRAALAERVREELRRQGASIERIEAVSEAEALRATRAAVLTGGFDAVIAAGGDGTIRLIAKAVVDTNVPIGVVPGGTGNVLAHEIALPRAAGELAHLLLTGEARRIQTARANGELFLLMAGAGFDGRIITALDHKIKARIGKLAYVVPTLGALRRPLDRLNVTIDGEVMRASWIVIANACCYGGAFRMAPRTHILRPGLEAIVFRGESQAALLRSLLALARGRLLELTARADAPVIMKHCQRVLVDAAVPVPTQLDGDAFVPTPLEVNSNGPVISLIAPRGVR